MNKYSLYTLICASLLALLLCSCQISNPSGQEGVSREPKELETFYPSDITQVDSIEIMSGSDGMKKNTVINHQPMEPHSELADRMTELYDAIKQ